MAGLGQAADGSGVVDDRTRRRRRLITDPEPRYFLQTATLTEPQVNEDVRL